MAGIYIKDLWHQNQDNQLIHLTDDNTAYTGKKDKSQILSILREITPSHITATAIRIVDTGFIINYPYDKDINFIFTSSNIAKLQQLGLLVDLRNDTKNLREVYIPDVSSIIYDTPDQDIKLEIEATNQISLISVKKFTSHDGTRFLVILTDSKETTERILSNRNITIYGDLLPAKRKYWPRKKRSNTTARSEENNTSHTTTPARNTNARSDSASALPPTSHWAGSRRPPTPTPAKHSDTLNFTTLKRQPRPSPSTYGTGHTNTSAPRPVTSSTTPSAPRPNQTP